MFISSVLSYHIIMPFLSLSNNFEDCFSVLRHEKQPQILHHTADLFYLIFYLLSVFISQSPLRTTRILL